MLTFEYTARNPKTGQKVKSQVQADNQQAAARLISEQGLSPIDIKAVNVSSKGFGNILKRVSSKDKVLFSRQLATLINAGLPLVQSLRNVAGQTQNKILKVIINQIITDVEGGTAFSAALSKYPTVFSRVFISMVAAGEVSGTLDKSLERLANQQEKDDEILRKVRGAMVYPIVVLLVMVAVVGFMIVKVLPAVEVMYKDMPGASLPFITRALLAVSHFITKFWLYILIALGLSGFFLTKWARTLGGKQVIDKAKMRSWPVGTLFMKLYMARFSRTGATLISSGVPLLQMLDITGDAINNVHVEGSIKKAAEKVKGGKALSEALEGDPNILELVPSMLSIGEQSGQMEDMMNKVADYYEKEVDAAIKNIQTIIEPVMMIVLGVVAFTIVAAVLLPIYSLAGKTIIK